MVNEGLETVLCFKVPEFHERILRTGDQCVAMVKPSASSNRSFVPFQSVQTTPTNYVPHNHSSVLYIDTSHMTSCGCGLADL